MSATCYSNYLKWKFSANGPTPEVLASLVADSDAVDWDTHNFSRAFQAKGYTKLSDGKNLGITNRGICDFPVWLEMLVYQVDPGVNLIVQYIKPGIPAIVQARLEQGEG